MASHEFRTIDLFAGAGGMSEGFRQAGFRAIFANDFEKPAIETFTANHPDVECSSDPIQEINPRELRERQSISPGELDVLIGGPPCQGFSTYGKRDTGDQRNQLYMEFIRFLEEFRPKTFVIENVVGILSIDQGRVARDILDKTRQLGYRSHVATLDSAHFGVPQFRKRVFFVGTHKGELISFPTPTHSTKKPLNGQMTLGWEESVQRAVTVRDAISDLSQAVRIPKETHVSDQYESDAVTDYQRRMRNGSKSLRHHSAKRMLGIRRLRLAMLRPGDYGTKIRERLLQDGLGESIIDELLGGAGLRDINECRREDRDKEMKLREILHGGHVDIDAVLNSLDAKGFANKYRRLRWDEPSHTLVAHMARDCSDFVHPEIDRFISVREAARLQSFRDNYRFCGSQFRQLRQIGNAVPPLLALSIAQEIKSALQKHYSEFSSRKRTKESSFPVNSAQ